MERAMKQQANESVFSRRNWLKTIAIASLADPRLFAAQTSHFAPKAKRIIWLT